MLNRLRRKLNNAIEREEFVAAELAALSSGSLLLDAGCGDQKYRSLCDHLEYRGQDFGQYEEDSEKSFATGPEEGAYGYGALDYSGNIWEIEEEDGRFDAILCTEVLEHVPYPIETIMEFGRLIRPGGELILTVPSNCLRHMDPFFFYSGFSDRFLEKVLEDAGFRIKKLEPVGDYYRWVFVELVRTLRQNGLLAKLLLAPAVLWYSLKSPSRVSVSTLCMGYHVVAVRGVAK